MATAVEKTSGRLSVVSAAKSGVGPWLGPTVFVDVEVNGVETPALVDTGSPATIISLDFVLQILADQRDRHLTPTQWKEKTLQMFTEPEVSLKSYGGHSVDILSQIPLQLKLKGKCVDAVVLVQKGAPNQLLLGTDVQSRLGMALVVEEYDLLGQQEHKQAEYRLTSAQTSVPDDSSVPIEGVHLVGAAGRATVVVVALSSTSQASLMY